MPVTEFRFHPLRRWRADFAWPDEKVLLEVEGGIWMRGRHTRGAGWQKDADKYNEASIMGYTLLRVTPVQLNTQSTIDLVRRALDARKVA